MGIKNIKEKDSKAIGIVTVRSYIAGTLEKVKPIADEYMKVWRLGNLKNPEIAARRLRDLEILKKKYFDILANGFINTPVVQGNLIMQANNVGKDLIIQRLLGVNTYSLNINYGAIGTSATGPLVTDTQLGAEVSRSGISFSQNLTNNEAVFQFFFPDANLTNTSYNEFGTFVDGTSVANSGQIFNHALFTTPYVKTAGIDTTVEVDFTIT